MNRVLAAVPLFAALTLAACGAGATGLQSSPPVVTASPSPPSFTEAPSGVPSSPSPTPVVTPTARPSLPPITADEQRLLDGVRRDIVDCVPVRTDLPARATAGIECASTAAAVARVGLYLFASEDDMLDAYLARMRAEGVGIGSGSCRDGEREGPYMPGDGMVPFRNGCFVNDEGYANYRATLPGANVYVGILGRNANLAALEDFAWLGNQDVPGAPTLWRSGG